MIRYILLVIIVVASIYLSIYIDKMYRGRIRVYTDFKQILHTFYNEISFKKCSFKSFLDRMHSIISSYTYNLILDYMRDSSIRYYFNKGDFADLYIYLDSVGHGDIEYELSNIRYTTSQVEDKIAYLEKDYLSNGKLYSKLILILGVTIAILLL